MSDHPSLFTVEHRRYADVALPPAFRLTDGDTARAAAHTPGRANQRERVVAFLRDRGTRGATDFETAEALGLNRCSAGKRRLDAARQAEEHDLAYRIVDSGERRETDGRTPATVWRLVAAVDSRGGV